MSKLTAKQVTDKHARRLKASMEDMRMGVEAVTVNPAEKALKKLDKMRKNFLESMDNGKVERGFKRVTLPAWKDSMINKGIPHVAAGIDGAAAKVEAFYDELLPHIDRAKAVVDRLPDTNFEDSLTRMTTFSREMKKFKRSK